MALCLSAAPHAMAVSATFGDLILGFRASGGTGAATNLEVNIGKASLYTSAVPGTIVAVAGLSVLDLTSTYGTGWATRSDLTWGIIGTTGLSVVDGAPARTIWASRVESTPGAISDPWLRGGVFTLQVPSNRIASIYTAAPGSFDSATGSPNSTTAVLADAAAAGSWTAQESFTPGVGFSYFNPTVSASMDSISTAPSAYDGVTGFGVLDLWDIRPGAAGSAADYVGSFGLSQNGALIFSKSASTFAAVPEPAVMSMAPLALILISGWRRRSI
jgi:hypothetical protein